MAVAFAAPAAKPGVVAAYAAPAAVVAAAPAPVVAAAPAPLAYAAAPGIYTAKFYSAPVAYYG